jgi:hypothetical protein
LSSNTNELVPYRCRPQAKATLFFEHAGTRAVDSL